MCRLSDGAWRGGVPRQTGKKVTKIFSSLPLIISNPGCERGRCSRRSVRPQPNRDLSLCNQTGIRLQLIFLCSLFITQRVPFIMLWSPSGAPPKPCPWMHPCAKGGDISRNFVIRNCCMSKVSSMMNQEAAWKTCFCSEVNLCCSHEFCVLVLIGSVKSEISWCWNVQVCQLKFTPPVEVQKPLLTKWCLDASPSVSQSPAKCYHLV